MQVTAVSTASKLDWAGWVQGIARATIGGGAGSVVTAFSGVLLDPAKFNATGGGQGKLLELLGMSFVLHAAFQLFYFLQTHPIPDAVEINTDPAQGNVQVKVAPGAGVSVTQDKK